jgi:hypothetical protein
VQLEFSCTFEVKQRISRANRRCLANKLTFRVTDIASFGHRTSSENRNLVQASPRRYPRRSQARREAKAPTIIHAAARCPMDKARARGAVGNQRKKHSRHKGKIVGRKNTQSEHAAAHAPANPAERHGLLLHVNLRQTTQRDRSWPRLHPGTAQICRIEYSLTLPRFA